MPLSGMEVRKIAEKLGWVFLRQTGSHMILKRNGKTLSIPNHKELKKGMEHDLLKDARAEQ